MQEIRSENDYTTTIQAVDAAAHNESSPPLLLRALMNMLEGYRQARKIGWSRKQNKVGVCTYAAFKLDRNEDQDLVHRAFSVLAAEFEGELSSESNAFLRSLIDDPHLMGFLFIQDIVEAGRRFEAATASLGRVAAGKPRLRDRVDVIVESEIKEGRSVGLRRMRAYVDPHGGDAQEFTATRFATAGAEMLLGECSYRYLAWLNSPSKHWKHWTQRYIDYFGPRRCPVIDSYFPTVGDSTGPRLAAGLRGSATPGPLRAGEAEMS